MAPKDSAGVVRTPAMDGRGVVIGLTRHITITKDKGISVHIDFDAGAFEVHASGDITLEIVETDSQADKTD